jgi:CRP/FNR family transcriptional regulator
MLPSDVAHELKHRYPLLDTLPAPLFDRLAAEAGYAVVPRGTLLFDERQACAAFPLLLEGAVRVSKVAASGRELQLYRVSPGESCILTSGCLLGGQPYAARGVAESETRLVTLPPATFGRLMDAHPPFRQHIFALFSERIAELMQLVEEIAFHRLDERLAALLVARGPLVHATHQALADDLGSVREMVTRLLRAFADQGWVRLAREQIEVLDFPALKRLSADRPAGA